ncbi:hypothetical protein AAHA92_33637 [Salvia divinorum]|uniref:Ubiquitin-like domain-containing protein n=1 Tax=Salvia divinorum TaxID=28513 RepID=A0ABD1FSB0_SALDI
MTAFKMTIKLVSPTSEFYLSVPETDSVAALKTAVRRTWGSEYFTLHHNSVKMRSDKLLSAYGVRDGSIIKVAYFAEFP